MNAANKTQITYRPCKSDQVAAFGYDPQSRMLGVKFHGRGDEVSTYHYFDVPQETVDAMAGAESVGRFIKTKIRGCFRYERQPDEPGGIAYGLPVAQEPKYTTTRHGRLVNRSSGVPIPDDEPVFVLRAKDRNAAKALEAYMQSCANADHRAVAKSRVLDFLEFAARHPERMKEPDSSKQDLASANVGRAPFKAES